MDSSFGKWNAECDVKHCVVDCLSQRKRLIIGHREDKADGFSVVRLVCNVENVAADGLYAVVEPDNREAITRTVVKSLAVID